MAEKTLPATGKRRSEARQRGEVARSADIDAVVLLAAGLVCLLVAGPSLATGFAESMTRCLQEMGKAGAPYEFQPGLGLWFHPGLLWPLTLTLCGVALALAGAQLGQVGIAWSDKALEWRPEKLSPIAGFKRLFSPQRGVTTLLALVKIGLICGFALLAIRDLRGEAVFTRPVSPGEMGGFLVRAAWEIGWRVLLALAVLAAADYLFQRYQFERNLRMSLDEIKDEHKTQEGSPEAKRRIRGAARKLLSKSFRRQLEDMADATIVITNPTHFAVALRYVRGATPAPIVVAKGQDRMALRLRERAGELGVPMIENKPLAQGLHKHAKVGAAIPTLYYHAVAGVLAELYRRGLRPRS